MQLLEALVQIGLAPNVDVVCVKVVGRKQTWGNIHHLVSPVLLRWWVAAVRHLGGQPQNIARLQRDGAAICKRQHGYTRINAAKRMGTVAVHAITRVAVVGAAGFQFWLEWVVPKKGGRW